MQEYGSDIRRLLTLAYPDTQNTLHINWDWIVLLMVCIMLNFKNEKCYDICIRIQSCEISHYTQRLVNKYIIVPVSISQIPTTTELHLKKEWILELVSLFLNNPNTRKMDKSANNKSYLWISRKHRVAWKNTTVNDIGR